MPGFFNIKRSLAEARGVLRALLEGAQVTHSPSPGRLTMRDDVSDKLVHLITGAGEGASKHREEAAANLFSILKRRTLPGGTGFIKGKHKCVCFSEAPISKLADTTA
jgi:hypothetical protein